MKYTFLFFVFSVFLISCQPETELEYIDVTMLRASDIYDTEPVDSFILNYGDKNSVVANSFFNKGLSLKETNPKQAVYFFKRAITLCPKFDFYKELAFTLLFLGQYEESREAFEMITTERYINRKSEREFLFQRPDETIYHEYVLSYILDMNALPNYLIYSANEMGLNTENLKDMILEEKRIKLEHSSLEFKNILFNFMNFDDVQSIISTEGEKYFGDLVTSIEDSSNDFEIGVKDVSKFKYSYDYEEFEFYTISGTIFPYFIKEKKEKPDSWFEFNYNHLIRINDSIVAIIYAIDTSENGCPIEMRHIYHRLVTYNKKGAIIDSKIVANQSGEDLMTFKCRGNEFITSNFKRKWKNPYVKTDIDNEIINIEAIDNKFYTIQSNGSIIEALPSIVPQTTNNILDSSATNL